MHPGPPPILASCAAMVLSLACVTNAHSTLQPNHVLVLYYAQGGETAPGEEIWNYYETMRPGVQGVNLASLLPLEETLAPGTISYEDFIAKIRDPLRAHLLQADLVNAIRVFVLTKGLPHRINDINQSSAGDSPGTAANLAIGGNATYASVDSELTLLWHDLNADESNRRLDSYADTFTTNPYFGDRRSITELPIDGMTDTSRYVFDDAGCWYWSLSSTSNELPLTPYLTCRLDGESVEDVKAMIDRAQNVQFDMHAHRLLMDRNESGRLDSGDYDSTERSFHQLWANRVHDDTNTFLIGMTAGTFDESNTSNTLQKESGLFALVSGYGANHNGGSQAGWLTTFEGQLVDGAIFNTFESYNGRKFGNVAGWGDHAQVSEWIALGGTFGLGHVWEPFALAVARNRVLLENFYINGLTWVESAWSAIQILSWQNIVVGDPLATATVNFQPMVTLTMTPSSVSSMEEDESTYHFSLTWDEALEPPFEIGVQFEGATLNNDFQTSLTADLTENRATATVPMGSTQVDFTIQVSDDLEEEGLELLDVSLIASQDDNQDGFGDHYSFLTPTLIVPIADSPYHAWRVTHFGHRALTAGEPEIDWDGDGLANIWEYAYQRSPVVSENCERINIFDLIKADITGPLTCFEIPTDFPEDFQIILETTTDLADPDWSEQTALSPPSSPPVEGIGATEKHEVMIETPPGAPSGFARLRARALPRP